MGYGSRREMAVLARAGRPDRAESPKHSHAYHASPEGAGWANDRMPQSHLGVVIILPQEIRRALPCGDGGIDRRDIDVERAIGIGKRGPGLANHRLLCGVERPGGEGGVDGIIAIVWGVNRRQPTVGAQGKSSEVQIQGVRRAGTAVQLRDAGSMWFGQRGGERKDDERGGGQFGADHRAEGVFWMGRFWFHRRGGLRVKVASAREDAAVFPPAKQSRFDS